MDLEHCATCGQTLVEPEPEPVVCGVVYPPLAQDVVPVRCQLPRGHRSDEHWHKALWPNTPSLLWVTDGQ